MEVACPDFDFDPARVEITSRGKMRSRRVNNLGSGQPVTLAYPLRFKAKVGTLRLLPRELSTRFCRSRGVILSLSAVSFLSVYTFHWQQPTQYFMQREEWRITDVIKNPMVMMMILPVILIGTDPFNCLRIEYRFCYVFFSAETHVLSLILPLFFYPTISSPTPPLSTSVYRSPSETDEQSRSGNSTGDAAVDERASAERRQHAGHGGNDDVHLRRRSAGAGEKEEREEQQSRSRRSRRERRRRRRRRLGVARQGNLEEKMKKKLFKTLSVLQSA